jgi:kynurenine formamidase
MNEIRFEKVYDLSVLLYNDMQLHPAIEAAGVHSRVLMHGFPVHLPSMGGPKGGPEFGWPIFHDLELTTHTGTHVDAPWHFNKRGRRMDELPIDMFFGKGVVIDFRHLADCAAIKAEDLEKAKPEIEEGDILIINTGRHKQYGTAEYNTKHPGLDGDSVEPFLLKKKIKMIGMDTMCVEVGSEHDHWPHPLHRVCLIQNEIPLIENLGGDIDKITGKRCYIMAFPLKIMADASIARVVAFA